MNKFQLSLATLAAAGTLGFSTTAPASADSAASTRNIILGAAAIAGIAIEANVAQKNARANGVSGYLADGSTVYGDGRITDRNGNSYYPGNDGRSVSCEDNRCYVADTSNANGNRDRNWNANQNRNVDRNANVSTSQDRNRDDRNLNRDDRLSQGTQGDTYRNDRPNHDDRGNR